LLFSLLTFNNDGKPRPAVATLGSYYASSMIATSWMPSRYTALGDGVRDGNRQVIMGSLANLVQEFWPEQTPEGWQEARKEGFQYCVVIEQNQLQAMAAVWRYSEAAWEVASVYTRPEARGRGYAQAVVSFVTAAILNAGRRATCSAAADNLAMQRVAEKVGFKRVA